MNFVADESVDYPIVRRLRQAGHTVWAVAEMEPGIADTVVLEIANQQGVIMITGDKDFGELVFRDKRYAFGVILLRLAGLAAAVKAEIVTDAINQHRDKLTNAFVVIGPRSVRIRPRVI
jgi:predicted nuclease of predicted toxin-antitoxin system